MKRKLLYTIGLALLLCSCNNPKASSITSQSEKSSANTSSNITSSSSQTTSSIVPSVGFNVNFTVDEHVSLTVYKSKNYDVIDTDTNIQTRNGDTGEYCNDGEESQVNFKLVADDGYEIESIICTSGTYNKVKWPTETLVENGYRVTKINADTTITIASRSKQADPEGYKVSFSLEHCTVQVHIGKDTTTTDTPDKNGYYYTRDKDSGEYTKNTDTAQMNFTVIPESGYEFNSGVASGVEVASDQISFITGSYNKFKNCDNNYYRLTKVKGELVITIACTLVA